MRISRKSWHYKLFQLVKSENDPEMSWLGYWFWSLVGLLAIPITVAIAIELAIFIGQIIALYPEVGKPVVYGLSALYLLLLIRRLARHTRVYRWLAAIFVGPVGKLFPPVTFVD